MGLRRVGLLVACRLLMHGFLERDGQYDVSMLLVCLHSQVPVEGQQFLPLDLVSYILLQVRDCLPVTKFLLLRFLITLCLLANILKPLHARFAQL